MSSSSSDSDSDDLEPVRKIKINIRPKDEAIRRGADVNDIKASIEAWRPLGPPVHPSLSRRQSSMSSVSSFGLPSAYGGGGGGGSGSTTSSCTTTTPNFANLHDATPVTPSASTATTTSTMRYNNMKSSPSCSSLVNEFTNRSSFSNFMSNTSRTSSPSTLMNQQHGDSVPIAIAIQESIEVTVSGQRGPDIGETKFNNRALGNIKVAFPNAFAQRCNGGGPVGPPLKLRIHSTENIIRYYASKFIKDLKLDNTQPLPTSSNKSHETGASVGNSVSGSSNSNNIDNDLSDRFSDFFDLNESPIKGCSSFKLIEFDMETLVRHLKQLYSQTPASRYFNVDVLRYQIAPVQKFEECPLQVCAYWKCEPQLVKVRIDFKHSNGCGINLERLRDIKFCLDLANFIPNDMRVDSLSPDSITSMQLNNNNNSVAMNMYSNNNNNNNNGTMLEGRQAMPGASSGGSCSSTSSDIDSLLNTIKSINSNSISSCNSIYKQPLDSAISGATQQHQSSNNQQNTHPVPAVRRSQLATSNLLLSSLDHDNTKVQSNNTMLRPSVQDFQIKLPPPPSRGHQNSTPSRALTQAAIAPQQHQQPVATGGRSNHPPQVAKLPQSSALQDLQFSLIDTTDEPLDNGVSKQSRPIQSMLSNQFGTSLSLASVSNQFNSAASTGGTGGQYATMNATNTAPPFVTYEPPAHWNSLAKQLTWKFDNLLPYYKSDGSGSLLAKLDFRNESKSILDDEPPVSKLEASLEPRPVDVKFMIVDSTLSKISISIDTIGYRMSLLKKEIRSGRYQTEPYIF